jgi:hypothetical protein
MIPLSNNFPPVRVMTKPAPADSPSGQTNPAPVQEAAGLSLTEATELLDWLENHRIRPTDLQMDSEGRMTIRWVG